MGAGLAAWLQAHWWRARPSWLARLLQPLAWLAQAIAAARRGAPATLDVPVIVVGNLVLGGAGKTPTVIALVERLRAAGWTPGVVSRGYGRRDGRVRLVDAATPAPEAGDEPLLIARRTGVPLAVGADRVAAVRRLRAHVPRIDVVVSDDGLQHHRLARVGQLIVFDERGAGNGLTLPAGPLREPMPPAVPPRSAVLYNAARASTPWPGALARRRLAGWLTLADWRSGRRPPTRDVAVFGDQPLLAAAGIAAPQRFFDLLHLAGLRVETLPLPDHASFDPPPWPAGTPQVIVTEKDAVKLAPERLGSTRVWVAPLDFDLPDELMHTVLGWLDAGGPARAGDSAAAPPSSTP